MSDLIYPTILCGGSGTRLWPLSRKSYPKQFSRIFGEQSLFQATVARFRRPGFGEPILLTNSEFRFIATQQLGEIDANASRILIEPESRNTGPAILAAALDLEARDPGALMLVLPSDHVIRDADALAACVAAGAPRARAGAIVTFGVTPDRAETGYGYLELADRPNGEVVPLTRFVEKPDAAEAEKMLASGRYLWNAGIFLFSAPAIIAAFREHAPALLPPCEAAVAKGRDDLCFYRLEEKAYASADDISIDYAVMEKAAGLAVVPFDGGWNDLGSWATVWGESGGGVATAGEATAIDCENTLLRSEQEGVRLVGLGLKNIAAIAMRDAVLVADLSRAQDVKTAVDVLKTARADQAENFPRVHRPWGWYETLSLGRRFQVKRIMVHPGAVLSLQSHVHRAEHWVVVEGTAKVTVDDTVKLMGENESIYVPLGAVHRLANPGKVPLHLIEVQSGPYLGEDDIIRYEDIYARG